MNLRTLIFGSPMQTVELADQRLPKLAALPVFASDALSSVAYATEEILLVLVVAGSMLLHLSLSIALVICGLLAIITLSYRQTLYAYPAGGGAGAVSARLRLRLHRDDRDRGGEQRRAGLPQARIAQCQPDPDLAGGDPRQPVHRHHLARPCAPDPAGRGRERAVADRPPG